jgi:hypothetical protein
MLISEGWCVFCIDAYHPLLKKCEDCDRVISRKSNKKVCVLCSRERWLKRHAEEVEAVMIAMQLSVEDAINEVKANSAGTCFSCGVVVSNGALFCTRPQCILQKELYRKIYRKVNSRRKALQMLKQGELK